MFMPYYSNELTQSGSIFWFCALAGSGMFLIQFIINVFGIADHDNFDSSDPVSDHANHDSRRCQKTQMAINADDHWISDDVWMDSHHMPK